jgi:hypothetical protein
MLQNIGGFVKVKTHMYTCIHMFVYMYVYIYVCIHICMYTYMYVYIYVCIHTCMYNYMYVYIYVLLVYAQNDHNTGFPEKREVFSAENWRKSPKTEIITL